MTRIADSTHEPPASSLNFIREAIQQDLQVGKHQRVVTRFPPEPNGYLHIGHAKSICLNFGLARDFGGVCHLRFDDTNPIKEEQRYIDAIKEDIRWLGFDWGDCEYYASDYFPQLYAWAVAIVEAGKAYVDDQTSEQIRLTRGSLTSPGTDSPYRKRSVEENLDLLERMKLGEFEDGVKVLRAKIDMTSPNLNLRDPVMYRILHATHPRTGDEWCIYPMYDWAHGQSDWIEGITHSICTLEFEDHRPLYEWYIQQITALGLGPKGVMVAPMQYEFARLNLTRAVMSKRKLLQLVNENCVDGWDDPRMPTQSGMRRRGYPSQALREMCEAVGVTKRESVIPYERLEYYVRQVLNKTASRYMAVLDPLKVTITNWPQGKVDQLEAVNNPEDASAGSRTVPFSGTLYIEKDDFMEDPPKKFFRLGPGREVRLRYAYFITCQQAIKNEAGEVVELLCTYDPATRGGDSPDGRKVKGTLHWVSADHARHSEVRLYDHLLLDESSSDDWLDKLNPESLHGIDAAQIEPALAEVLPGQAVQFERLGYFTADSQSTVDRPLFHRAATLRDTWAKEQKKG